MSFNELQVKGLTRCLVETGIAPEKLRFHISEVGPGARSHAAHTHDAIEAFYVFEGRAEVEIGGERQIIGPNEALMLDARTPHGISNAGDTLLRYLVIIAPA